MGSTGLLSEGQLPGFLEWKKGAALERWKLLGVGALLLLLVFLAGWRSGVSVQSFLHGIDKGLSMVGGFFPPDWSQTSEVVKAIGVTAMLSLLATILGMCLSLPFALLASSNLAPGPLRLLVRGFIGLERGMPEIVQVLLMIPIFGLGAIPGLIALCLSSVGMLARLLADTIEEIEPHMLEAVAATGATKSQVIRYAVIPQVLPALLANGLFRLEFNVRESVMLGAIGAGGIGYLMRNSMESADYQTASLATFVTLVFVFSTERVSDFLRGRILSEGAIR
jgi:phosphonate transport system permease protein